MLETEDSFISVHVFFWCTKHGKFPKNPQFSQPISFQTTWERTTKGNSLTLKTLAQISATIKLRKIWWNTAAFAACYLPCYHQVSVFFWHLTLFSNRFCQKNSLGYPYQSWVIKTYFFRISNMLKLKHNPWVHPSIDHSSFTKIHIAAPLEYQIRCPISKVRAKKTRWTSRFLFFSTLFGVSAHFQGLC